MTNDYKENLLKYLTGNVEVESKSDTPFVMSTENNEDNSIHDFYSQIIVPHEKGVVECDNGYYIAYGTCSSSISSTYDDRGYLLILDSQMTPLELLTQYDTGTYFSPFFKLRVDEQGQIYGVDYSSSQFRVILLNNVSVKLPTQEHFVARLRNSYFFQGDIANCQGILDCVKSTTSAKYFICGRDSSTELLLATEFQINVGSTNTWTNYSNNISLLYLIYLSTLIYYDANDNVVVNIYFQDDVNDNPIWQVKKGTGETLVMNKIINSLASYEMPNSTQVLGTDILPIRADKFYLTIITLYRDTNTYYGLKTWLYDSGELTNVFTKSSTTYTTSQTPSGSLSVYIISKLVGTTPILTWSWRRSLTSSPLLHDYYITFLDTDVDIYVDTDINLKENSMFQGRTFGVSQTYNLFQIYLYYQDNNDVYNLCETKVVYNENNYNGVSYENTNSVAPSQALLYDENNKLIFARNLYNKKAFSNQTISTINVPNSMLNDLEIGLKELYSETNTKLEDDSVSLEKNIYEDLYINFISSIYMQNQNTNDYIDNLNGATRLNTSSSKFLDYDEAKASKIRVTYDDGNFYITGASCTITDNVGTYTIGVHVPSDRNIESIEIMSYDENTVYQTITNLNLEKNKYYIITQDVYVV